MTQTLDNQNTVPRANGHGVGKKPGTADAPELRLTADPSLSRRGENGRVLLGGSPYRVLRLSRSAAALLDRWQAGEAVGHRSAHRRLAARLIRAGVMHPEYQSTRLGPADVTVVVPVRDHANSLALLLEALGAECRVVVVDDGSAEPLPAATVRHDRSRGPAAARNTGWRAARTDIVAFLDADVIPEPGWLEPLLRHFEDPQVAAAAPRVRSLPGGSLLARYEQVRSPLDLGGAAALVRPGSRVSYVPSAALVVRRSALIEHDGFDEEMRFGEDVDLVWRMAAAGALVRYAPESQVWHAPRTTWRDWARQRFGYGTSAAPLALRHGRAVAPVKMSKWSAASWAALAAGAPATGLGICAATAALLPRKLSPVGMPAAESFRLAMRGHLGAGRLLADAATRSWWPVALPALACSKRGRVLIAAAYAQHARDWFRRRPPVDLPHWVAARAADDLAYGAGVWWGALRNRTVAPLLPDLADWPGRNGIDQASEHQDAADGRGTAP